MMGIKKILIITATSFLLGFGTAQASDEAIYQITTVKGKALVQMPDGHRQQAKPGMQILNGSELIVLRDSQVNGFDIQNNCEVEYQQLVRSEMIRDKMCALAPVVKSNMSAGITGGMSSAASGSLGLLGTGGMKTGIILGGVAGLGLLAAALDDDDSPASP